MFKLVKGEDMSDMPSLGSWITIGHPAVAEIMAAAGFEWLTIDLEHSAMSIERAEELIRVIELSGVKPLVRLSSNNAVQIKEPYSGGKRCDGGDAGWS